jgi:serine/threonine-protein kinase
VFLARLSGVGGFQRFVAIKRLHPHLAKENEFVQMFLDEARLAAGIHHPNVVPILEVGASDRGYHLVMEYIEGDTLARLLARAASGGTPLPLEIALRIVVDMLAGLHAAHELRDERGDPTELVHRDVSPQNVLVGADGISRIADFGVARAATRLSATRAGQLKGKIAYMAPEQAAGEKVDRRADVFASGIVLWEVLCARRLFKGENDAATLNRVLSDPIPSPREHVPSLPRELADVCMKALERDANRRYASCAQFADALERATAEASLSAVIAPPREVAEYVSDVIGNEIREQREAVRAWLAFSEPSQVAPVSSAQASPGPDSISTGGLDTSAGAVASGIVPARESSALRGWVLGVGLALLAVGIAVVAFSMGTRSGGMPRSDGAAGTGQPAAVNPDPGSPRSESPGGTLASDAGARARPTSTSGSTEGTPEEGAPGRPPAGAKP